MNIHVRTIQILENGGGGGCAGGGGAAGSGSAGSGDVSGFVGTGGGHSGSVPGIFNYNAFKKKRKKKHKKHKKHESIVNEVSATGGNDGAMMGGEVYGMGTDLTQSRQGPSATGDLIESPVDTSVRKDKGLYGIPKKKKHRRIKRFKQLIEHSGGGHSGGACVGGNGAGGVGTYTAGASYGDRMLPNPGLTNDLTMMPLNAPTSDDTTPISEPVDVNKVDKKKKEKKLKIMNWDSYIKAKMNQITYLN